MSRFRDEFGDESDDEFELELHDEDEDEGPPGQAKCPRCDRWWPRDHMETDSGDCITCEESESWGEEEE